MEIDGNKINAFARRICAALDIEAPEIQFSTNVPDGSTVLAWLCEDDDTVHVREGVDNIHDICFALAHELRHVWQRKNTAFFDGYKPSKECESLTEYNLQLAEIDANAYAALVMVSAFGVKPLFNGLPDEVKTEIYTRMNDLSGA